MLGESDTVKMTIEEMQQITKKNKWCYTIYSVIWCHFLLIQLQSERNTGIK